MNQPTSTHSAVHCYRRLLACLRHEEQALKTAREADILAAAREKELILQHLAALPPEERLPPPGTAPLLEAELADLTERVAAQASRNRAIIDAALEVIADFWELLRPPGPGLYHPAGRVQSGSASNLLHRTI